MPSRPLHVTVVDDDSDVLGSLRFLLEAEGFNVTTYDSGAMLLTSELGPTDCFVIDYKMESINGLDLVTHLRQQQVQTPIILITGYPDRSIAARAVAAGADDVLYKPHVVENLAARIHQAATRAR